jgi:hypothetical protein
MACLCSLGHAFYYIWHSQKPAKAAKFAKTGSQVFFAIIFFSATTLGYHPLEVFKCRNGNTICIWV